jgi:riboflavin kinase/FMN adenylyltransferase
MRPPAWITIGSYDGVHIGHQAIIRQMVQAAHQNNAEAVVITFYPHPAVVLRGAQGPYYLTTPEERSEQLQALGVDQVITLPFDRELAALSAEAFMQLLIEKYQLKQLWIGYDFALGRGRQGTPEVLSSLGEKLGYTVKVFEPILQNNETVSSSQIRALLGKGDLEKVAASLGHCYTVTGPVVHGQGRGRGLGIPTANMDIWAERLLPVNGIYATWVWLDGKRYRSVTNVGIRPTFEYGPVIPRVEAHILDFNQDIYDKTIKLEFASFLRPEERFIDINLLIKQMHLDIEKTRQVLTDGQHTCV